MNISVRNQFQIFAWFGLAFRNEISDEIDEQRNCEDNKEKNVRNFKVCVYCQVIILVAECGHVAVHVTGDYATKNIEKIPKKTKHAL